MAVSSSRKACCLLRMHLARDAKSESERAKPRAASHRLKAARCARLALTGRTANRPHATLASVHAKVKRARSQEVRMIHSGPSHLFTVTKP